MRMSSPLSGAVLCALGLLGLRALPAGATTAPPLCAAVSAEEHAAGSGHDLLAETSHTGVVDLYFDPSVGAPVKFYECVHGRAQRLGTVPSAERMTGLVGAVPWLCGRRRREFRSTTTYDGRFVRRAVTALTPTCAHRFTLTAPRRMRRGRTAAVTVSDTWGTGGIHVRLCLTS